MTVNIEDSTLVVNENTPHEKKYNIAETVTARPLMSQLHKKTTITIYGVFVCDTSKLFLYHDEDAARFHAQLHLDTIFMTLQIGNGNLTTID